MVEGVVLRVGKRRKGSGGGGKEKVVVYIMAFPDNYLLGTVLLCRKILRKHERKKNQLWLDYYPTELQLIYTLDEPVPERSLKLRNFECGRYLDG